MAHPDVAEDLFKILAPKVREFTGGMTLYASSRDTALEFSRVTGGARVAGRITDDAPTHVDGIETIDISALGDNPFGLNHETFAGHRSLISDIGRLLARAEHPPPVRSPEIRGVPEGATPPQYWRFP
jgi:esterase/lipase superfamily enzyme